ncbi:MAG: CRISPR-associated endoribonuclease Cas6 [Jaaginema sp. PMC 1079.18]|nr:CRISPR-associated endoribonuclease Cas6 [Jaaginema sp. PMC 1080.18]MEC4850711.1 CRISPR-associated endoribonuclease Cas6 [Jaaginema sp. PMC 1079.18]MEC4864716.1 CRISPR-associated endoribonuclease Cas6 [Jaaginema sp. PMC 1078.18]
MTKSATTILAQIPDSTELVGLVFELSLNQTTQLYPNYTTGLHAWLLHQVRSHNPQLSQNLHDNQSEKSFTLSRLTGKIDTVGRYLQLYPDCTYLWYCSVLAQPTIQWLKTWLKTPPNTLDLRNASFNIDRIAIAQSPTTYSKLLKIPTPTKVSLSFISPTSFRSKGHHLPLPIPNNLFHSYLRRWNHFSQYPIDQTAFLHWIDENVVILRHRLETAKVPAGKRGSVTGFLGAIELALATTATQNPEFYQLFFSLVQFAPYCGTGHKTPFGLGQTRLGWQQDLPQIETLVATNQLAQRIAEIAACLMQQQKRTGGNRAQKICQTRATILARREMGESLQAIAQDLEMPYETVKTYAKLARRTLNMSEK